MLAIATDITLMRSVHLTVCMGLTHYIEHMPLSP